MSGLLDQLGSQDRHDLRGAVRVLRFAVDAIKSGERFDDADGAEQIRSLEEAVSTIERVLGITAGR